MVKKFNYLNLGKLNINQMISKLQTSVHTFKWNNNVAFTTENVSKPLI